MSASELPVHYHDVVGVAVITGDEGLHPQEIFRYPFFNEDPSLRPLGHFDRIPPDILTKLLRTTVSKVGENVLLEMVFDGVRLISCPVQLFPERGDAERTAVFFSLVFAVVSEYHPQRQLYPPSHLPKHPRKKEPSPSPSSPSSSTSAAEAAGASATAGPGGARDARASDETPPGPATIAAVADAGEGGGKAGSRAGGAGGEGEVDGEGEGDEENEVEAGVFPPAAAACDGEWGAIEVAAEGEARAAHLGGGGGQRERKPGVDLALLRGAVLMVSRAMNHEEWKNGYISKAGKHLLEKRDRRASDTDKFIANMNKVPLYNGSGLYANFGGRLYGGARQYSPDEMRARGDEKWQDSVMEESQLAMDMRTLYEGLTSGKPFEMTIKRSSGLSINVTVQREVPAARRFETLLLREEKHIALAGHPRDGSPQIRRLIEMADPHKTFEELAYASEIELSQMLRLARHLVFWGDAIVIDTLCASNRYQVTREVMKAMMPGSPVQAEFFGRFPRRDLMHELKRFGDMRPLSRILEQSQKSTHKTLIAVLTLLLRRDLLVQVQRYVTLAIPEPPPDTDAFTEDEDEDEDDGADYDDDSGDDDDGVTTDDGGDSDGDDSFFAILNGRGDGGHSGPNGRALRDSNSHNSRDVNARRSPLLSCIFGDGGVGRGGNIARGGGGGGSSNRGREVSDEIHQAAVPVDAGADGVGARGGDGGGVPDRGGGGGVGVGLGDDGGRGDGGGRGVTAGGSAADGGLTSMPLPAGGSASAAAAAAAVAGRWELKAQESAAASRASAVANKPSAARPTMAVGTGAGKGRRSSGDRRRGRSYGSVVGYRVDAEGNTCVETPSLKPFEEEYLRDADDGSEESRLMRRLAPLLRGKLSIREIVWRLEVTSTELLEGTLAKYGDVLYEVWRPAQDPRPA